MFRKLKVATCQFSVSADIGRNLSTMKRQIKYAAEKDADVVHFSECCLSAYGGFDFNKYSPERETLIQKGIAELSEQAKYYKIRVIYGTHFFEGTGDKPFNSLFVINAKGETEIRYDKRLLSEFDLDWYKAGTEPGVFEIEGIKCGLLICHEWRYPELYRQYYHLGVELLFQSWYDGNYSLEDYETEGKILQGLFARLKKQSALVVSHRVSALEYMDEIIVLNEGMLIAKGSHETLLKTCPYYYETWQLQRNETEAEAC